MLKSLFSRIKSEKSSTVENQLNKQFNSQKNREIESSSFITPQQQTKLSEELKNQASFQKSIVKGQMKQIRYWTNSQIPNIFSKVIACPISHYNLLPHSKRKVKQIDLKKEKFPQYLEFMKPLLEQQLPCYNHILINHYPKGIGIMHHFDGPMYRDKVVVLSLGGPALISFQEGYSKQSQNMKILLEDKSIHIFEQDSYRKHLHGIEDNKIDSFTFEIIKYDSKAQQGNSLQYVTLKSKQFEQIDEFLISESSIKNMDKIQSIRGLIEKYLQRLVLKNLQNLNEQQNYCIQFDESQGVHKLKGCFIFLKDTLRLQSSSDADDKGTVPHELQSSRSDRWRWKMQIQRQQRISITIRQKYMSSQNY